MPESSLSDWLSYIEKAHVKNIDMGLGRMQKVLSALNLKYSDTCIVTVAGTNGKGTTCKFIERACFSAGLSIGLYSSPHIQCFNERIKVNEQYANDIDICNAFEVVREAAKTADNGAEISLTYFEYATLCAFVIFAEATLDLWVIEVGLGGRLDASNVIDADIAIITSIGLDHQDYLGDTEDDIAAEKAGIIKANKKVVVGYPNAHQSLLQIANNRSDELLLCGKDFGLKMGQNNTVQAWFSEQLEIGTTCLRTNRGLVDVTEAKMPQQNLATALAALRFIVNHFAIKKPPIKNGADLQANMFSAQNLTFLIARTQLPGRFEIVQQSPMIIVDVAHNKAACELLSQRLKSLLMKRGHGKVHLIIGMLKDKNIEDCIDTLFHLSANWYCVDLPSERGEKAQRFQQYIEKLYKASKLSSNTKDTHANAVKSYEQVKQALSDAIDNYSSDDIILVVGSFVLASEFMLAYKHPNKRKTS